MKMKSFPSELMMPRPKNVIPTVKLNLKLPEDIRTRLDIHLYSELEGRVPQGHYQAFFIERCREFFEGRRLDLAPYIPGLAPSTFHVFGTPEAISLLESTLKGLKHES